MDGESFQLRIALSLFCDVKANAKLSSHETHVVSDSRRLL